MGYIPFGYLRDFFEFLAARRDVEALTYADLDWGDDRDAAGGYPGEARAWREALRSGRRDPAKAYVVIQQDVDTAPEQTVDALRVQERLGVRSNVMIFNRRINRRLYRDTGRVEYTPYFGEEQRAYLQALERKGFVVGYHCNAYERSAFSAAAAQRIMLEDIEELRRQHRLGFMSAHGGPRDAQGRSNNSLPLPDGLEPPVRWVHNGYTLFFDATYSDGGMNSGRRPADAFDLRRFVAAMRPGGRYRVLLHPQYYGAEVERNPKLESAWYDEVLRAYSAAGSADAWRGVEPARRAGTLERMVGSLVRRIARR
jgi:hypothetical protein